ncbi:hypothetical protein V8C86DRAFT_2549516 [Haematococcus lacustris]
MSTWLGWWCAARLCHSASAWAVLIRSARLELGTSTTWGRGRGHQALRRPPSGPAILLVKAILMLRARLRRPVRPAEACGCPRAQAPQPCPGSSRLGGQGAGLGDRGGGGGAGRGHPGVGAAEGQGCREGGRAWTGRVTALRLCIEVCRGLLGVSGAEAVWAGPLPWLLQDAVCLRCVELLLLSCRPGGRSQLQCGGKGDEIGVCSLLVLLRLQPADEGPGVPAATSLDGPTSDAADLRCCGLLR